MIFSMGSALSMPALSAIAAMEGRDLGVGATMSVLQSAMSLGMIAGPLMSGVLADLFNIRLIFFVGSGIALFGTIVFVLLTFMRSSSSEARDATHFFASKP
jgi:MFS family permease